MYWHGLIRRVRAILAVHGARAIGGMTAVLAVALPLALAGQTVDPNTNPLAVGGPMTVVELEGTTQVARGGKPEWDPAYTNQVLNPGDLFRTLENSRATLRLSNQSLWRVAANSLIRVPEPERDRGAVFHLLEGIIYFFHRDKPREFPVETPTAHAVIIGTEFALEVTADGATILRLIDGQVELTNRLGRLALGSGQSARATADTAPLLTPALATIRTVQWGLYYPGVLNLDDLELAPAEFEALRESLAHYQSGDLQAALAAYPDALPPASLDGRVFRAALLLAVGQVDQTQALAREVLTDPNAGARVTELASSFITVLDAVLGQARDSGPLRGDASSTACLAESYALQSRFLLAEATRMTRLAVTRAPGFAFAWARLAELEFSQGRLRAAQHAIQESLRLASRNAAAWAVRGFLDAGENRVEAALNAFDRAIALDGALGNAWLGRGLCRVRMGDLEGGLGDLQVAVTLEPQRAILRAYLGKAQDMASDPARGRNEVRRARELDPADPTGSFYAALLLHHDNRVNEAVREMEHSQTLNNNRRVYRSRLLLDQDRAMRSVNLALLYEDAGMQDWSAREAGRAVEDDYANASAHLFLGNSYQALRDLRGADLRFETAAVNEYLIASLLAPVGGGTLAHSVSQLEYSKLLEQDGFGFASQTDYLSYGHWIQSAAQFGTLGTTEYAVSGFYRSDNGQRPNDELEQKEWSLQWKQQLTAEDDLYFRTTFGHAEGGDLARRYDPNQAIRGLEFEEEQEPLLLTGYHHAWGPGSHTLLLGGWFRDAFASVNPEQGVLVLGKDAAGDVTDALPITLAQDYQNDLEFASIEAQHIWQSDPHSLTVGARVQGGEFATRNVHQDPVFIFPFLFPTNAEMAQTDFERQSLYAYYRLRPLSSLQLIGGVSYDHLVYPENFRQPPLASGEESETQWSPKGGLIWTPTDTMTLRGGYAQSLGGVSFDQSFGLEPTLVGGFNQAFRSLIPESAVGAQSGAHFEMAGLAWEHQIGPNTYWIASAEWLTSEVEKEVGVYDFEAFSVTRSSTPEALDFRERAVSIGVHQLLGQHWAVSGRYRLAESELHDRYESIPLSVTLPPNTDFRPRQQEEAILNQVELGLLYNHQNGFFGRLHARYWHQSNHGYVEDLPGDDFWQFDALAGYRFWRRRAEITIGLLNMTDQDYRINPLSLAPDLPRERTFMARFRLNL